VKVDEGLTWKPDEKEGYACAERRPPALNVRSESLVIYLTWEDVGWWRARRMGVRVTFNSVSSEPFWSFFGIPLSVRKILNCSIPSSGL